MEFKLDKKLGYRYAYSPNHYLANGSGKVYEHIFVMVNSIKRPLADNECVHHKDRNRANNDLSNLQLMTIIDHARLHQMEDNGVVYIQNICKTCKSEFETTQSNKRDFCSAKCSSEKNIKFHISKEELELLVWSKPTTQIALMFNVSDVAVAKRCKKLGVNKPPRGYWSKINKN